MGRVVTAACFFFKEICNLNLEVFLIQLPNVFEKPQISNKWQNITTFVPKTCGLSNGVFTLPETETDTDTDKLSQNPIGICVSVCICTVWGPLQNSAQYTFNRSLYQSRCRVVWTHHKVAYQLEHFWTTVLSGDTFSRQISTFWWNKSTFTKLILNPQSLLCDTFSWRKYGVAQKAP